MIFERIKIIREKNELTQKQISTILDISQSNYSRWENGKEFIPLEKLTIFCNYFSINPDYIFNVIRTNNYDNKYKFNKKTIGKNLRKFRKQNNLTQKELACFLNTTQSTISAYESGKTTLLTAFAIQIVKKYHISLEEFLK